MTDTTYNGWTNRETWLVNLWLTNEQAYNDTALDICTTYDLRAACDRLEGFVDSLLESAPGFAADMINAALGHVNWSEIVLSMKEP